MNVSQIKIKERKVEIVEGKKVKVKIKEIKLEIDTSEELFPLKKRNNLLFFLPFYF